MHVFIEIVRLRNLELTQCLIEKIKPDLIILCNDKYGICLIKAILNTLKADDHIFDQLLENVVLLAKNPYGNFAIQQAISRRKDQCVN